MHLTSVFGNYSGRILSQRAFRRFEGVACISLQSSLTQPALPDTKIQEAPSCSSGATAGSQGKPVPALQGNDFMIRSIDSVVVSAVIAHVLAWAASAYLAFAPLYTEESSDGVTTTSTLLEVNGSLGAFLLLAPIVLTGVVVRHLWRKDPGLLASVDFRRAALAPLLPWDIQHRAVLHSGGPCHSPHGGGVFREAGQAAIGGGQTQCRWGSGES